MTPELLIVSCGGALRAFRSAVCSPNMPTVDLDAVLSQVVWAVATKHLASRQCFEIAEELAYQDGLFGGHQEPLQDGEQPLSPEVRWEIYQTSVVLMEKLFDVFTDVKAYCNGVFPYAYQRQLDTDTLVLKLL